MKKFVKLLVLAFVLGIAVSMNALAEDNSGSHYEGQGKARTVRTRS